jgi:hypothetical protein
MLSTGIFVFPPEQYSYIFGFIEWADGQVDVSSSTLYCIALHYITYIQTYVCAQMSKHNMSKWVEPTNGQEFVKSLVLAEGPIRRGANLSSSRWPRGSLDGLRGGIYGNVMVRQLCIYINMLLVVIYVTTHRTQNRFSLRFLLLLSIHAKHLGQVGSWFKTRMRRRKIWHHQPAGLSGNRKLVWKQDK